MALQIRREEKKEEVKKNEIVSSENEGGNTPSKSISAEAYFEQTGRLLSVLEGQLSKNSDTDPKLLKELIETVKKGDTPATGYFEFNELYTQDTVDLADELPKEEWVEFIAYRYTHVIVDDVKANRPIRAPFKPIVFKYQHTRKTISASSTEVMQLCSYTCKSKKELDFLENHQYCGISFFPSIGAATNMDARKASMIAEVAIQMKSYDPSRIIQMTTEAGLPKTQDLTAMKNALINKFADDKMKSIQESFRTSVENQLLDAKGVDNEALMLN